jgi:1-acylglycerone phosphate reductase
VFATARGRESIADLDALGMDTLSLVVDDEDSVRACYAEVEKRVAGKGLDFLVNNAYGFFPLDI